MHFKLSGSLIKAFFLYIYIQYPSESLFGSSVISRPVYVNLEEWVFSQFEIHWGMSVDSYKSLKLAKIHCGVTLFVVG